MRAHGSFASASCGALRPVGENVWELPLRDDGDASALPARYRMWWAACLEAVPQDRPIVLRVTRLAWPYLYVPVCSRDAVAWAHLPEADVRLVAPDVLELTLRQPPPRLYLAQSEPYPPARLDAFLRAELAGRPGIVVGILPGTDDVPMVTLGAAAPRGRVWVHARAHPGETGASFVAEGLLLALCDGGAAAAPWSYTIVPCMNPTGVAEGRSRTDPQGCNTEEAWHDSGPRPATVAAAQAHIAALARTGPPFVAALNLHSSNEPPDRRPYVVPHFGPDPTGHPTTSGGRLYARQCRFAAAVAAALGPGRLEPPPAGASADFLRTAYPETWWWHRSGEQTMALTIETVYGRAGAGGRWMQPADHRALGAALATALMGSRHM